MSRMTLYLVLILTCLIPWSAGAQKSWNLEEEKNGIRVFTRQSELSKFDEVKVECAMEGKISQLIAAVFDIENHVNWVYKTKTAYIIKRISDTELYFYTEISSPWPFRNRDAIAHIRTFRDSLTNRMLIEANSVPDYIPHKEDIVRIPRSKVIWTISALNNHSMEITYFMQADPGGSIPAWLINMFVSKGPYESFSKLREIIKLPLYK